MAELSFPALNTVLLPGMTGAESVLVPRVLHPLDVVLGAATHGGFRCVGLDNFSVQDYHDRGGDLHRLSALLETHALRCPDVGVLRIGESAAEVETARRLAGLATATGARLCATAIDLPPGPAVRHRLARCADVLNEAGVRLAVEFLPYGAVSTLDMARELCAALGWDRCGLLLDTWMFFRGANSWHDLRQLERHEIAYLQFNDAPPRVTDDLAYESRHRRVLPGQGVFPLDGFVEVMAAVGFDGVVSVEVLSAELRRLPPGEQARQAWASLQPYWSRKPGAGQGTGAGAVETGEGPPWPG